MDHDIGSASAPGTFLDLGFSMYSIGRQRLWAAKVTVVWLQASGGGQTLYFLF